MQGGAYMTQKEVHRAEIFSRLAHKQITKTQAAEDLDLSLRQVLRLNSDYKKVGRDALCSKKRGKSSNHQLQKGLKEQILDLIARDEYSGFRPTFMSEKLREIHGITISRETLRNIMIQSGIWSANNKKRPVVHQLRKRRARDGELVQIDGSPHHWFEDRGEACDLLVYIDDATGRTFAKFVESESTKAYMDVTQEYIKRFGKPRCFYSDKHGVFRVNKEGCVRRESLTQFGRALKELEIQLIYANSPQAKGRVERVNRTLQDRLVKDLRLNHVNTIEEANQFLEKTKYWDRFNEKFSVAPESQENAHRALPSECVLDEILCFKTTRKVSKNFELQFNNVIYQICPEDQRRGLQRTYINIIKKLDGTICMEHNGKKIRFREYGKQIVAGETIDSKEIDRFLRGKERKPVSTNHPWKRTQNNSIAA